MNEQTKALFKTLTELPGPSGFEHDVRAFVRKEILKHTNEVMQDKLGGIFGVLRGDPSGPKVMVAGHMDEVGFMVTKINEQGLVKFQTLGGWWSQVLLAQRVQIMTDNGPVIGVIGSTPPHLLQESQRSKPMPIEEMYIDVGADDKGNCIALGIKQGQAIVPECPFTPMANEKKILAKAWDNRYGVGLALELLAHLKDTQLPNTVFAGATVQEEVGLRGAATASNLIEPDLCYVLDASPANDATGGKDAFGHLGKGALVRIFDRTMITHKGMRDFVLDTAETHNIPYQFFLSPGGTDAGRIHTSGAGVPSVVVGVCARYIHTSSSILHVDDYAAAKELLIKLVQTSDRAMFEAISSFS
ncbi:M42 family metallopeptidase [Shouchella lonarensis]|uniref:Aminopeptidase FrvX n=1 Tax=Shouchella lonarensis TaxID=1464122 RepID=A0A1G6GHE4_9BACI|nr:M42 family metallopeptidase [Shouchella lonarensis]SDB81175.1 Putative aminopeptidase FrvX [Shouchella lonarensis]